MKKDDLTISEFGVRESVGVRKKGGTAVSFVLDWENNTCHVEAGCVFHKFELDDVLSLKGYHIHEPKDGWKTDFTDDEKSRFRQMAETLAMLDRNAFFGNTYKDRNGVEREWYEMYLPEAHALYSSGGGFSDGWHSESSI